MKRLLIANRGEIALRIARTARERDLEIVAVHAPEDAALAEGYGADELVALPGRGAAAYLDVDAIVGIARAQACDALHPGYGFLSERAALAEACREAGITFVGPPPAALALFGDKAAARALAAREGVPIVPGVEGPTTLDAVRTFVADAGPDRAILLKAVAGGGGRGMRRVTASDDLETAWTRASSEARRAFGTGDLYAERVVEDARHVEVQVAADRSGAVVSLHERDCSLQRRHQKLIELAPAPWLSEPTREALVEAALRLARAGGLVGVGTVEFLVDGDGDWFFIEANPRLQVEHTVTEAITGLDLVELQLALAEGASLASLGLDAPPPRQGMALQLRILAESLDADGQPRPANDPIEAFDRPSGPGVRLDTALRPGLAPAPTFDTLIAKLVVHCGGDDFERLRRRARRALGELAIEGPATNLALLDALLEEEALGTAAMTTSFFDARAASFAERCARGARSEHSARSERGGRSEGSARSERSARRAPGLGARGDAPSVASPSTRPKDGAVDLPPGVVGVEAPLIGTVLELGVAAGDAVTAGDTIAVLESMKMEHVVQAETTGVVEALHAAVGDVLGEGALIAAIRPSGEDARARAAVASVDLDAIRPDLAAVQARHALLEDAARPEAVARRRSRGQRTARENLAAVCDPGTFNEYGALAIAAMKKVRPVEELERRTPADAIITGTGSVNGDFFPDDAARCALLVVDATVLAGTQGFFHHKKIDRILELAEQARMPVIFYPEGGGGRPNDTDASDVFVAGLNITSFHAFAALSGKVPRIAVVSGFCFAGSAAFAGCADVIIATRNTSLGMGGPAMIEGGGLGVHAPEDVGPVSIQAPNGVIDVVVEDEVEAAEVARRYLSYFQGPLDDWTAPDPRRLRHVIPENRRRIYDVRQLIDGLCDEGSVLELRRAWGVGMITALVRIEGRPMGLLANDPRHLGGAIDDEGAEKAARFLQLCDAFGLPVLSLCDTPGFMVGPEIEARAQVRKVSRLFVVGANLSVPLFCVITRKGYGLGAQAMAGGGFTAPFDTVAWPTGEIGGMGLEGAVNLGFKKQLDACETEPERQALFEKLVGVMYDKGKALHAASALEFDAVIDPAETRGRIVRGLKAHGPIARPERRFVDTW